ncbi:MAG: flavin monoamine oxidase family protein [Rhodanobacteraceae bacterium]
MADQSDTFLPTRRAVLRMIGLSAGSAAMYQAMIALGFARESKYAGPVDLAGAPAGASVLILGAGLAGMTAAYELRNAGYRVQVLEYNDRPGGRNWTLRGGDSYTELGGARQKCEFDQGLYINPGPWRIPYHHQNLLHYCQVLGVKLEPFVQVNYNAYLHRRLAFGGKPQRYRAYRADYQGMIAELLAKSVNQHGLDAPLDSEDRDKLLASLSSWGFLDQQYRYARGDRSSAQRGYDKDPGGGLDGEPIASQPMSSTDVLRSQLWQSLFVNDLYEFQTTLFQPVGGMGHIGEAFGRELGNLIQYNSKVVRIAQDDHGVTAHYQDAKRPNGTREARADWCLCTIPLSILSQIPMNVGADMAAAISAVPYAASAKIGLQFKRRFWEEDEQIYGGVTFTDLPISIISYPSSGYFQRSPGVLLGAYAWGANAFQFAAMSPAERVREAVRQGSQIHPQYMNEFQNGIAVAWHRVPFAMGCFGEWTDELRGKHYDSLCRIDGRIALAGEHASYLPAWQEGAVTSALDAIRRLHPRVVAGGVA